MSFEPQIFATEKGHQGKRKYLVGEFGQLADWYWRKTALSSRHLYEVIWEGSLCRLYFDLEFSRPYNSLVPELKLPQELEEELATELQLQYGTILPTQLKSSQIVNLDSSNENFFSRHWIVHLLDSRDDGDDVQQPTEQLERNRQQFLLKDAPTVGRFVKRMMRRLAANMVAENGADLAKKRPALAQHLFVNTKDLNKKSRFIDLGVYTRNRLFRCLGSSKKGKATILQPVFREKEEEESDPKHAEIGKDKNNDTDENEEDNSSAGSETGSDRCYFPLSIPYQKETEIEASSQSSSNGISSMEAFIVANDWEPYAQALADSMVVPLKNKPFLSSDYSSSLSRENNKAHDKQTRILEVKEGSNWSSLITNFIDTSK